MKTSNLFFVIALVIFFPSCSLYTEAKIKTIIDQTPSKIAGGEAAIYQWRVGGIQGMTIMISKKKSFFSGPSTELLTEDELSKLKISINPQSHNMSANGKTIISGTTSFIDLRKSYDPHGLAPVVILDTRISSIQVASFPDSLGENTLCDFIITVEDRGRITPGLSLSGGFQDGF